MTITETIIDLLASANINYTGKHHDPTFTSEESAKTRGEDLSSGAKAIVYKIESEFYLFVMAANEKIDTKKVKAYFRSLGQRAKKTRFASKQELLDLTGLVPGSVPPFGQPVLPFQLFVDPSLLKNDKISFNAGSLTYSITLSLLDYTKISNCDVFPFTIDRL